MHMITRLRPRTPNPAAVLGFHSDSRAACLPCHLGDMCFGAPMNAQHVGVWNMWGCAGKEPYLTVEDVLGRRLLVLHVPHQGHAVRLVGGVLVVVVRGDQQLRILVTGEEEIAAMSRGDGSQLCLPRLDSM